jgi:hypothetical protein
LPNLDEQAIGISDLGLCSILSKSEDLQGVATGTLRVPIVKQIAA